MNLSESKSEWRVVKGYKEGLEDGQKPGNRMNNYPRGSVNFFAYEAGFNDGREAVANATPRVDPKYLDEGSCFSVEDENRDPGYYERMVPERNPNGSSN